MAGDRDEFARWLVAGGAETVSSWRATSASSSPPPDWLWSPGSDLGPTLMEMLVVAWAVGSTAPLCNVITRPVEL